MTTFRTKTYKVQKTGVSVLESSKSILHWDELPKWMKIDPHIQHGYRQQLDSFTACYWSLFYSHNELVNTWSHLLPGLGLLILLFGTDYSILHGGVNVVFSDLHVLQLYIAGTAGCLFFSAFYHCSNAHSEDVSRWCLKLDYLGVVLSITVSSISSTYFGLKGDLQLQVIYIMLSICCAAAVFQNLLGANADGPRAANWRVAILVSLFCTGFAPILHKLATEPSTALLKFPLRHTAVTTICYVIGTAFYITRFPEKQIPNVFDVWGASHQIFHIMVAIGQTVFLFGLGDVMLRQDLENF